MRSQRDEHIERLGHVTYLRKDGFEPQPHRRRAGVVGNDEKNPFPAVICGWQCLRDKLRDLRISHFAVG